MNLKKLLKNSIAQGTIEYLVIIAVVVVLSLIVVALVINVSSSPSQQVLDSSDKLGNVAVGGISIVEAVSDLDGDTLISLMNNSSEGITLKKISVGENDNNYDDYISGVDSVPISLTGLASSCPCESGQKSVKCEFVFEYLTKSGLTKIERRTINVQCTNSNEDPSSPSTRLITPTNSCGAIASLEGYTPIDECSDVSGAGNYLFTKNMTCNITITANDVNIHGNNCVLNGNIIGNSSSETENGYNFTLISLIAGNVSSSNTSYVYSEGLDAGSGGNIILIDSNVLEIISNGGDSFQGGGNCGFGGNITLINSSASSITSNGGTAQTGSGIGGNGGDITLTSSSVSTISSDGGDGYYEGEGGNGGSITLNNVSDVTIISARGGDAYAMGGNGGIVLFNPDICPTSIISIDVSGGDGSSNGLDGTITPTGCGQ